ncbi:hypothetical protein [Micromonospora sp. NBRC 101691]|uniref:hypothetical protein n=1 Tax=Micromonospora sp. NBRC 101691 TaxID=3032198 RepID=UPI0024A13AC6|nr:hypothetical protein [Micromonospora sp. NBRC 101691]GLY21698.1 hypothetical protein Misp04_14300 [Micromonospora sp. NBRC 101691]
MPTEFVRVRDKDKTESSLPVRRARQLADRGDVEILDAPAVNGFGEPLPPAVPDSTPAKTTSAKTSKEPTR